jgi:hypothetical protein
MWKDLEIQVAQIIKLDHIASDACSFHSFAFHFMSSVAVK